MPSQGCLETLDSSQLDRELKSIPGFIGTLPKDELIRVAPVPCCAVINNNNSNQPGSHWTCLYTLPNQPHSICFDSMGAPPNQCIVDFLHRVHPEQNILYYSHQIQQMDTDSCGWYCIYMLHQLSKGISFDKCLAMFTSSPRQNEALLRTFFAQYHISNLHSRLPYPVRVMTGRGVKTPVYRKHARPRQTRKPKASPRYTTHSTASYRTSATSGVPLVSATASYHPMSRTPLHFTRSPIGLLTTNNVRLAKDHSTPRPFNPLGLITDPIARLTPYIATPES